MNVLHAPPAGIITDPHILGGTPVFAGTRVPVVTLFEHLESGCSPDEFFDWFPTVKREAAVEVLMEAHHRLTEEPAPMTVLRPL